MSYYARFDCDFPDDPKVIQAGDLAELLYFRCVLKCRQTLSDGVIHRDRLPRWAAGINAKPTTLAGRLVRAGLWEVHPDGWQIPPNIWKKWNPTAKEIQTKREDEAERKRRYREERRSEATRPADVPTGQVVASRTRPAQSESKTEAESKTESKTETEVLKSSSNSRLYAVPPVEEEDRITQILNAIIELRLKAARKTDHHGYRASVAADVIAQRPNLEAMIAAGYCTDATPELAAQFFDASTYRGRTA